MNKCSACVSVIEKMNHKSPVGYVPFGWGPSGEDPNHYYVMTQEASDADDDGEIAVEVDVTQLCQLENPVCR